MQTFLPFFTDNAADYLHGRRQRRGYACGTFMSPVWSFVCGVHPTLSPSSQVPRALDPAHTHRHPGGFSIGSTCPHPITQYLQRNYYVIKPASLVLALEYFDELRKHLLGGTGWSVVMAQILGKPLLCVWLGYGTMVLVESHPATLSTLGRHDRGTDSPTHVTGENRHCRHPRRRQGRLSHLGRFIPTLMNKKHQDTDMTCNTFNKILNVHSQQQCVSSFPRPSWLYLIVPWLCLRYYRPVSFCQSWPVAFRWGNRLGSLENGQSQKQCLHSSDCPGWRGFGPFPPSYQSVKIKNSVRVLFHHQKKNITDNLWSNIRWQWWQWDVLGTWKRTTTWFHHLSCPRCCGRPMTSHLGNPLNSRSNVFRLSIVTKHSTQNMIFTCASKGNTLPYGLSSGSTNPWYFISTSKHECGLSALFHLIHLFLGPITYSC